MKNYVSELANEVRHFNAELTRGCNQACIGCFNYSGKRLPNELSTYQWFSAIDLLKRSGALSGLYTGGEIMTRRDTPEILEHSLDAGIETGILSNGYRINRSLPFAERDIVRRLRRAQISLNSGDPRYHNKTRGKESAYTDAIKAIGYLRSEGVSVEISCTVFPGEERHLEGVAGIAYVTGSKIIIRPFVDREKGFEQDRLSVDTTRTLKERIQKDYGDLFIEDFARYVPLGSTHDEEVSRKGIITIQPDGRINGTNMRVFDIIA